MKVPGIIIIGIISVSMFSCKTEEIILHGDITGIVTDATTGLPVQTALVKLSITNDTISTGNDGSFLFENLTPREYEIQASKPSYATIKQNVTVASAETKQVDLTLNGIPVPNPSVAFLDFGLDSTSLRFTISNTGKGHFAYFLNPSKDWITVSPSNGDLKNETKNIIVTINKTGLSEGIYKETIKVISFAGQVPLPDITIPVYLNGVSDRDGNYYKVVTIGTQTYMAENLKTTRYNDGTAIPYVNNQPAWNTLTTPGYCWYNDAPTNKDTYGGMYNWYAVNTGKLCPTGWHVPTDAEWRSLPDYLGGTNFGYKLKEIGTIHWLAPNDGTNESGFTALPGGARDLTDNGFFYIGTIGAWWSSTEYFSLDGDDWYLVNNPGFAFFGHDTKQNGLSVRCLKD